MQNSCRECHQGFDSFNELKDHFATEHVETFIAVERWVAETTGRRLKTAEELAAESMLGFKDRGR